MEESTIVLLGRSDAGKTTFVKAVQHAVDAAMPGPPVTEEPTLGIMEYKVPLPDGRSLIFLDTPGFDGYQPGERAMETEEILQMLDEHLEATGNPVPVSHVLVFADANDMATTEFKGRARRAFERLFSSAQVACITTRWDQIADEMGAFVTPEEVQSKEESLYAIGREVTGSLMEYLHDGRSGRGDDALHFRSGLRSEAYSSPQDIILKLFAGPGSDNTLEERLAAVTKERDELAARYALLLQEQQATTTVDDAAPPQEAIRTPRTRRQRLLDTIDKFSAQVLEMGADLERESLDVADERAADRAAFEAASTAIEVAEGRLAASTESVKVAEEEHIHLAQGHQALRELERSLTKQLDELGARAARPSLGVLPSVNQRLSLRLEQTQAVISDMEGWISTAEDCYNMGRQEVERATAEIEKWDHIKQEKERELNGWLSSESKRLLEEQESFRNLQMALCTSLDAMREGLKDSWEGKLRDNCIFWERLDDRIVKPEMIARPGDWAPVVESFYETQVARVLTHQMAKFYSAVVQRLNGREAMMEQEWKNRVEGVFVPMDLPPPPPPLIGHSNRVWGVAFSWDGRKIASGSVDKTVRVWDALTGKVQAVLEGHSDTVTSVAFSPDGEHIVSGSVDNSAIVWDVLGGRVKRVLEGHTNSIWSVAFSADGSRIISGSDDKTVRIWDAATGQTQRTLEGHTGTVYSVVFLDKGSKVVSGSDDKTVRVWDALTGTVHTILKGDSGSVGTVAALGDGLKIVSGSADKMVRVWDVLTGEALRVLKGHSSCARSVALSPDGSWIVSGSFDKTLRVWDASTGGVQSVLEGHSGMVFTVALSRDGRRIASGSDDKTIRVWDILTSPVLH